MKWLPVIKAVGHLLPFVLKEHEFKPKRAVIVLLTLALAIGGVKLLGADDFETAVEATEDVVETLGK